MGAKGATGPAAPSVYVNPQNGKRTSLNGVVCGISASTYTGALGGYAGAKLICEATCSAPAAHLCSVEEVMRTATVGATVPIGAWFSTGTLVQSGAIIAFDCAGWTYGSNMLGGSVINGTIWGSQDFGIGPGPQPNSCGSPIPVMCCL